LLLPAGTVETIVLDQAIDSAQTEPGAIIRAHLRDAIVVRGKTLAPAGSPVQMIVSATRRAGNGVSGEIMLRLESVHLVDDLNLPMRLLHPVLSPLLVAANAEDIALPSKAAAETVKRGANLVLPHGTMMRAKTALTIDATDPHKDVLVPPPPYTISTEKPYSAFTPIPLVTYSPRPTPPPRPRGRGRGRGRAKPSPSPSPSPSATESTTTTPSPASATPVTSPSPGA